MPESSTAMPTPVPSSLLTPLPVWAVLAPVASSSELAVRAVGRFGEMLCTSLRAANCAMRLAGSITDSARTDR
jgi:hypothetical protein